MPYQFMIHEKIRAYGDKVYTNFCGLNVSENSVGQPFLLTLYLFIRTNICLQVYLNNCVYKL